MSSMPTPPEDTRDRDRWLPLAELLRELSGTHGPHHNLTYYKVRCALLAGRLPAKRLGREWRVAREDLAAVAEALGVTEPPARS